MLFDTSPDVLGQFAIRGPGQLQAMPVDYRKQEAPARRCQAGTFNCLEHSSINLLAF